MQSHEQEAFSWKVGRGCSAASMPERVINITRNSRSSPVEIFLKARFLLGKVAQHFFGTFLFILNLDCRSAELGTSLKGTSCTESKFNKLRTQVKQCFCFVLFLLWSRPSAGCPEISHDYMLIILKDREKSLSQGHNIQSQKSMYKNPHNPFTHLLPQPNFLSFLAKEHTNLAWIPL